MKRLVLVSVGLLAGVMAVGMGACSSSDDDGGAQNTGGSSAAKDGGSGGTKPGTGGSGQGTGGSGQGTGGSGQGTGGGTSDGGSGGKDAAPADTGTADAVSDAKPDVPSEGGGSDAAADVASDSQGNTEAGTDAAADAGDATTVDPAAACKTCSEQKCMSTALACLGDAECGAIYNCRAAAACTTTDCKKKCVQDHPNGQKQFFELQACPVVQCHDICTPSGCIFTASEPACNTCVAGSCATQCSDCDKNVNCIARANCISACAGNTDTVCIAGCDSMFPGGKALFDTFFTCLSGNCASSCS